MIRDQQPRILIVEDDYITGQDLRRIVTDAGLKALGPIPGVQPAMAAIRWAKLDAALLSVWVDGGPSFPLADELDEAAVPYAFVTAAEHRVAAEPRFAEKPVVRVPNHRETIVDALRACGIAPAKVSYDHGERIPDRKSDDLRGSYAEFRLRRH